MVETAYLGPAILLYHPFNFLAQWRNILLGIGCKAIQDVRDGLSENI